MNVRWVTALLVGLLVVIHGQMWFGRGSVTQVRGLRDSLEQQQEANALARQQNEQLANEVRNLRDGLDMIEEKARSELGMVKPNEIFVQVQPQPSTASPQSKD
jgi:cell division protein FtsB